MGLLERVVWTSVAIAVGVLVWLGRRLAAKQHRPVGHVPDNGCVNPARFTPRTSAEERARVLAAIIGQDRPSARPDGARRTIAREVLPPFKGRERRAWMRR